MLLHCVLWLLVWAIVAAIVLYILGIALAQVAPLPAQIVMLVRCLVALVVLLWFLSCVGLLPSMGRLGP